MKFLYEYRTSDNVRHTGTVSAASRDAAFAALKAQGIRPGSVTEAPGFFNKLFGKGKRWLAIGVLAILCVALAAIIRSTPTPPAYASIDAATRRQIIGDSAVIEKGIATGWADVFADEGDRFLASFAVPGYEAAIRTTTEEALRQALRDSRAASCADDDGIEARQVRAIVAGMKDEIRALLDQGWTIKDVGVALVKRQDRELGYCRRAKTELEQLVSNGASDEEVLRLWETRNDELRNMGLRLLPLPERNASERHFTSALSPDSREMP